MRRASPSGPRDRLDVASHRGGTIGSPAAMYSTSELEKLSEREVRTATSRAARLPATSSTAPGRRNRPESPGAVDLLLQASALGASPSTTKRTRGWSGRSTRRGDQRRDVLDRPQVGHHAHEDLVVGTDHRARWVRRAAPCSAAKRSRSSPL